MNKINGGTRILCLFLFIVFSLNPMYLNYAQDEKRISMDFQSADLKSVLKIFSQQAGLNFVATKEVESKPVTLYLDQVTVQDALDSIIFANGLTYEQKPGSSVFVVREAPKARIDMITKVYNLNYARVVKAKTSASDEGSEASDSDDEDNDIKSIIQSLLTKDEQNEPYGNVVIDPRTNSIIITTLPNDFPLIEETLSRLDTRTRQVMIEAEIIEVNTTAMKKLGLDWGSDSDGTFFTFTGPTRDTGFPFTREASPFSRSLLGGSVADSRGRTVAASATGTTFGNLSLAEFRIVLRALEKENEAKYLARPKIMVVDNETAEIKITADTAISLESVESGQAGNISTSAEREETGIILKATPTINKDDYVTMTLEPEVSRVQVSNISSTIYDPTKRSAKTTVMMKDSQTIAIGGLLKQDTTDNNRRVPALSKVPILGNLFQSKDFQEITTEIIIFVTCYIVKPDLEEKIISEKISAINMASSIISEKKTPKTNIQQKFEAEPSSRDDEILKTVTRLRKKREMQ